MLYVKRNRHGSEYAKPPLGKICTRNERKSLDLTGIEHKPGLIQEQVLTPPRCSKPEHHHHL